ncbi:MAG: NPCBM/NEW2 domain-containing protein, partial [Planctomycetes bacterium]|nr:NPCBM/NEW2 domain-containing protein [Planctomycetota bacterium]
TDRPRTDLLSIRGTEAERQVLSVPDPPPPRPAPALARGAVFLSELPWASASSGWTPNGDGLPRLDKDIQNKPLRLGPRHYTRGIGTHAPSEIIYPINGRYARFQAEVGGAEEGGTVVFRVFGDGELLAETAVMHGLRESESIDVSVEGVQRLRLVVTDAGDNYYSDMANWASPRLLGADPTDTP